MIPDCAGLTSLEILRPYCFQDQGYSAIGALTKLHKLSLGCSWMLGLEKEPLHFCSNLQNLRDLSLRKCFASDESLEPLAGLTSLERLSLHHLHRSGFLPMDVIEASLTTLVNTLPLRSICMGIAQQLGNFIGSLATCWVQMYHQQHSSRNICLLEDRNRFIGRHATNTLSHLHPISI